MSSPRLSRFIEGETFTCAPPSSALFNDIIVEMDRHQSRSYKRYASSSISSSNSNNGAEPKKHKRSASTLFSTLTSPKKENFRKSVITLSPGAYETLAPASSDLSVRKNSSSSSEDEAEASSTSKKRMSLMKGRFGPVTVGKVRSKRASVESLG